MRLSRSDLISIMYIILSPSENIYAQKMLKMQSVATDFKLEKLIYCINFPTRDSIKNFTFEIVYLYIKQLKIIILRHDL